MLSLSVSFFDFFSGFLKFVPQFVLKLKLKNLSGPVNDPYFVAQSYVKFAKKKKINKTEEVFKEALIQAESAYLTKIGKDLPPGQYKCRKWKYIERNKGLGSDVNLEIL